MNRKMRTLILMVLFLCSAFLLNAQYESGRITTIGFGAGDSRHAGSYTVTEDFRTKTFSGFRALIIELKLGWNFKEMTSIYGVGRFSPPNSIISPYRSLYLGIGASQALPFYKNFYLIFNYGHYRSSLGDGVNVGRGGVLNLGAGMRLDDNIYMEINNTTGNLSDIDPRINISNEVNQLFGTVSFRF